MSSDENEQKRLALCMAIPHHAIKKAVAVLGWTLHSVNSVQEAIQAINNRPYEAFILTPSHDCNKLLCYAYQAAPSMFRIVYSDTPLINWEANHAYFSSGADAVVSCRETLLQTLCSFVHFESIVPVGTKIASASIYSSYIPLRRRQQREDQLILISKGTKTVRVKQLLHYTLRLEGQLQSIPRQYIHTVREFNGNPNKCFLRVVHVSDTNTHHRYLDLPSGDLFVHTGNFTNPKLPKADAIFMFADFLDWLHSSVIPRFAMVVFIAGNHDDILDSLNHQFLREHMVAKQMLSDFLRKHPSAKYLQNSSTNFRGLTIYGSPTVFCRQVSRDYNRSIAFERRMRSFKRAHLDKVDILLTNRAPSILDHQSDYVLPVDHVYQIRTDRKRQAPKIHAFGHCNKNFGIGDYSGTLMMNGSQELLHSLDKYGGGTPLVIDIPLPESEAPGRMCGPRFFKSSVDWDHGVIEV